MRNNGSLGGASSQELGGEPLGRQNCDPGIAPSLLSPLATPLPTGVAAYLRGFKMPVRWASLAVAVIRTVFRWFTRAREYQIALGLATQ
jgi:hypothetical protein